MQNSMFHSIIKIILGIAGPAATFHYPSFQTSSVLSSSISLSVSIDHHLLFLNLHLSRSFLHVRCYSDVKAGHHHDAGLAQVDAVFQFSCSLLQCLQVLLRLLIQILIHLNCKANQNSYQKFKIFSMNFHLCLPVTSLVWRYNTYTLQSTCWDPSLIQTLCPPALLSESYACL